jgi:hypothetical protein
MWRPLGFPVFPGRPFCPAITSSSNQTRRFRPERSFVVANPQMAGHPPNVPGDLEPSKKWTGTARPRRDLLPDWPNHRYWVGIYTSHRDRPYLIRLPKIKPGPPENSKSV